MAYNEEHGIKPTTIKKEIRDLISISKKSADSKFDGSSKLTAEKRRRIISELESEMKNAAEMLEFEYAIKIREKIRKLKEN